MLLSLNPILGQTLNTDPLPGWNVAVAGRFDEHYSDFDDTLNGKLATRYQVLETAALRRSVPSGFRTPSLAQQFFTATSTNFIDGILFEIGTFRS